MTTTPNTGRDALRVLPLVVVPAAFIAAIPWLKTVGDPLVSLIAGGMAGVFVVSYANYLSFLFQRGQDEVQQASMRIAAQWGIAVGQAAFVLLLVMPPFLDLATALVRDLAGDPGAGRQVVVFAMTFGFCCLVLLQGVGSLIVRALWWRAKQ